MISHPVAETRAYLFVWLGLLALLGMTVGSAYLSLGWFNTVANLGIAAVKALLVMIFFMHLRAASTILRIFAAAGFFWLAILIGLSLPDVLTR
jgi:cytochrome c oxidase subunit IV